MKKIKLLLVALCCLITIHTSFSQKAIPNDLSSWIDQKFKKGVDSLDLVGATIIVIQGDSIIHKAGYGVENIETQRPTNPDTSIFTIASISKTITATAIMQLYEQGKLDLDQDINTYLKSLQIVYPFRQPITVRHLLTHTAGFDERNLLSKVRTKEEVISLREHLMNRMPPQIRNSGEVFDYSNYGYALLGLIIEDVSGIPFSDYVTQNITQPLAMDSSSFDVNPDLKNQYVVSYLQKDGQLTPYASDFSLKYPAGGFMTTTADMGNYIKMYLKQSPDYPISILKPSTKQAMWNEEYQNFPNATQGWALGFETYRWRGKKIVGHGGDILGFTTDIRFFPEKNIGLYMAFNSSSIPGSVSKNFMETFKFELSKKLWPEAKISTQETPTIGETEFPLETYEGIYRFTRYATTTLDKLAVLIGFAPEITIEKSQDSLRIKKWGTSFYPVSDNTYFSPERKSYVAFGKNHKDEIAYFYLSGTEGYHKLKWYQTVNFQMLCIGFVVVIALVLIVRFLIRKSVRRRLQEKIYVAIALLSLCFLGVLGYTLTTTDPQEFLYGLPTVLIYLLYIPFIISGLLVMNIALHFIPRKTTTTSKNSKLFSVVVTVTFLCFIWWLWQWNLIGFNY